MDFNIYIFKNINTSYHKEIEYFKSYRLLLLLQSFTNNNNLTFTYYELYYINAILINVERYIYAEELSYDFSQRTKPPRQGGQIVTIITIDVIEEIKNILIKLKEKNIEIKELDITKVFNEIINLKQELTKSEYYKNSEYDLRISIRHDKRTLEYQLIIYKHLIEQINKSSISTPSISTPSISTPSISMPSFTMPSISTPSISMPSMFKTKKKTLEEKKAEAKQIIDLAFRDLYQLFEFTSDHEFKIKRHSILYGDTDTEILKEEISNIIKERLDIITPNTKNTYTYTSGILKQKKTIPVAFGGENKKKTRKLKKYIS